MEQLLYEIQGIKYVLVERQVTDSNKDKMNSVAERHNCIFQGVKEVKQGGFLSNGYAIVKLLVPEDKIISFNKES